MKLDAKAIKDRLDFIGFLRDRYGITFNAKGWGRCLFADLHEHGDTHPSMQLSKDGCAVRCWAGDHLDGWADCFAVVQRKDGKTFPDALRICAEHLGLDALPNGRRPRHIVRRFPWSDSAGLIAHHLRWEPYGEGLPKFTWAQDPDGTQPGQPAGFQPTLYQCDTLTAMASVILCEGEHDAETINQWLDALGYTTLRATCTPNGAGDVKPAYLFPLHGKQTVYLSGHTDAAGQRYVDRCGELLKDAGLKLFRLEVPSGKDWAEWAEAGGTAEQFAARLAAAPEVDPRTREAQSVAPLNEQSHGSADELTLARLSALPLLEYGAQRKQEAHRLGVPVGLLDKEVHARRKKATSAVQGQGRGFCLADIEPSAEPVEGRRMLQRLVETVRRFAVLPPHGPLTVALWALRAHAHDLFDINPRLALLSPEKGCGKTTVLTVLTHLVPRPLPTSNATPAVIFRVIEAARPTLLLDEMDSFEEAHEELRGLLNSGHVRAFAQVIRTVGEDHEPRTFSTWCPMAFAAIGRLAATLEDRSIIIPMKRRMRSEAITLLRRTGKAADAMIQELATLARQLARWVQDHAAALRHAEPEIPEALQNRAADNWAPLLAIAEAIGGPWPQQAREAAVALSGCESPDLQSAGVQLLADIRALFEAGGWESLGSQDLCDRLIDLEERPWAEWRRGKPLSPPQCARLLRPFGVSSRNLRHPDGAVRKGYSRGDFEDAFARYLPSPAETMDSNRYTATTSHQSGDEPLFQSATEGACSVSKNGPILAPRAGCSGVADQKAECGDEEVFLVQEDLPGVD